MRDKVNLFKYRRASTVKIYKMEGFEDYFYGYMVPDTSYLDLFALIPYDEGFVLQMPKRLASSIGTVMVAMVQAAPVSLCCFSMSE